MEAKKGSFHLCNVLINSRVGGAFAPKVEVGLVFIEFFSYRRVRQSHRWDAAIALRVLFQSYKGFSRNLNSFRPKPL